METFDLFVKYFQHNRQPNRNWPKYALIDGDKYYIFMSVLEQAIVVFNIRCIDVI